MKYVVQVVMFVKKLADWVAWLSWVTDDQDPKDNANSDETGLFFHASPCTTPCVKGDSLVENSAKKSQNFSPEFLWLAGLSNFWLRAKLLKHGVSEQRCNETSCWLKI